jgi:hypothetical protein
MLKLLQCIFGGEDRESYPESLVAEAIERAVDVTDPQIRAVSGYKKKLRAPVILAIDHVVELVERLPPVQPVRLGTSGDELPVKGFFISAQHMKKVFTEDPSLAEFLQGPDGAAPEVFALMAMEKQERGIFGAALSGDVVIKDVPQVTVSFDAHRFLDPTAVERETRRLLKRRAYDHLLTLALRRLAEVKTERSDLERRRTLLQAKLNLLARKGWGFDQAQDGERIDAADVEERMVQMERNLQELGGDDRVLEKYLETVAEVLGRPAEYLASRSETILVDRMGIKQSQAGDNVRELNLSELYNAEGRSLVVTMVSVPCAELRGDN